MLDASVDRDTILTLLSHKYSVARETAAGYMTEEEERRQMSAPRRAAKSEDGTDLPRHFDKEQSAATRKYVKKLNLFDDDYFRIVLADNREGAAEIVRPVLQDPDAEVLDVQIQKVIPGQPTERSVCIDVRVALNYSRIAAIEVQRKKNGMPPERARFIQAREDTAQLEKGDDFGKLYDVFTIILSEVDPYERGLPMYHIDKTVRELNEPYNDGRYLIYVNGLYHGDDDMGRLMHDPRATEPAKMYNPALRAAAARVKDHNLLGGSGVIDFADASPQFVELMHRAYGTELQQKDREIQEKHQLRLQQEKELQQKNRELKQMDREMQEMASELARLRALVTDQDAGSTNPPPNR